MADRLEQLIEMECADALLDSGVSVPLKRWKLPWLKRERFDKKKAKIDTKLGELKHQRDKLNERINAIDFNIKRLNNLDSVSYTHLFSLGCLHPEINGKQHTAIQRSLFVNVFI